MEENKTYSQDIFICFHPFKPTEKLYYRLSCRSEEEFKEKQKKIEESKERGLYYPYVNLPAIETIHQFIMFSDEPKGEEAKRRRIEWFDYYLGNYLKDKNMNEVGGKKQLRKHIVIDDTLPGNGIESVLASVSHTRNFLSKKGLIKDIFYNPSDNKRHPSIKKPIVLFNEKEVIEILRLNEIKFRDQILSFYFDVHLKPAYFFAISYSNYSPSDESLYINEKIEDGKIVRLSREECFKISLKGHAYAKYSSLYRGRRYLAQKEDGSFYSSNEFASEVDTINRALHRRDISFSLLSNVSICKAIYAGASIEDITNDYHVAYDDMYLNAILDCIPSKGANS